MNGFRYIAALFAALVLTGCSLLKVAVSTGDPLSKDQMNTRVMTRGFYYDMAGEVARAADSIVALASDPGMRIAAIRWKLRVSRTGVDAAMQGIPDVALADMWILCRRMNSSFAAAPDSLLFGRYSDLARDVARRLDRRAAKLAAEVLSGDRYRLMSEFVGRFVRENPMTGEEVESANTTLAWLEYLKQNGVEHAYAVGSIAEVLSDVNDRVSGQTQQLSNSVGWSKDMLEIRFAQDSLRSQVGRQLDSLERSFNRIVTVTEHLPEISDQMIRQLNSQVSQLIYTVDASINNAFGHLDIQRTELQKYISIERDSLMVQARRVADDAVKNALEGIPVLIGKVLLYLVLALVVLLGAPFAAGFWLGTFRERRRDGKDKKAPEKS